jgi:putative membrane protein insertion efficiency factor
MRETFRIGLVSRSALIMVWIILMLPAGIAAQDDLMRGPWQRHEPQDAPQGEEEERPNPGRTLVNFYKAYISPIDGSQCGMYPSCSEYGAQAFEKHGFFTGWMMTMDRLFRCGRDELKQSPWVRVHGEFKCYDPVERNDFWWTETP